VVLATGNFPSTKLPGVEYDAASKYIINPWHQEAFTAVKNEAPVLIVGSGLTMADTVLSLYANNFNGEIIALSRHGQLPMPHPNYHKHHNGEAYTPTPSLNEMFSEVKSRIQKNREYNDWHEPVLESIRPFSQQLWQQFSVVEKERFLRHLNHRWSRLRHRLPSYVFNYLEELQHQKRLKIVAGKIQQVIETSEGVEVIWFDKHQNSTLKKHFQRIYNCTGPEGNIGKLKIPLIESLLKNGLVRACPMKLGYDATADGKIINAKGNIQPHFYLIGPGLKGVLWESTAIPEIRVQARNLATAILN
jgi:uncharacterized NAD(P)/FAD-binding protein YdhS